MNREGPGKIEYLDWTWSPVVGCGYGCSYCWARRQAKRQKHNCRRCYDFKPHLHPERLDEPLKKRKPSVIGVVFMGDLFDPTIPFVGWASIWATMLLEPRHTFVVLTKQPKQARERIHRFSGALAKVGAPESPAKNIVLGVSPTDQESADRLIPELMQCPAATRFVSIEPMRGPVNPDHSLRRFRERGFEGAMKIDGVILGGQTGPGAVPMHPDWVRAVRGQCAEAGVPFYFKAWGKWGYFSQGGRPLKHTHTGRWVPEMISMGADLRAYNFGPKHTGRTLDGRTHDGLAWTKGGKA